MNTALYIKEGHKITRNDTKFDIPLKDVIKVLFSDEYYIQVLLLVICLYKLIVV